MSDFSDRAEFFCSIKFEQMNSQLLAVELAVWEELGIFAAHTFNSLKIMGKKKREFPNTYVIIFGIILVCALATWFVPGGEYVKDAYRDPHP